LAELLQLNEMTIYRMVAKGVLPCYDLGRVKRFGRNDIDKFLESRRSTGRRIPGKPNSG
jgi:excisionase family DNA binding protein